MSSAFFDELNQRGLVYQSTPGVEQALEKGTTLYFGIDPTGADLHVGHLLGLLFLRRALQAGNRIILLVGGGTSMIGDPSGKESERPIMSIEQIEANKEKLKTQISRFFTFDGEKVKMVDNADWLNTLTVVNFLRDTGKYISINSMLDKDSVQSRIGREEGISYAEFSYQLLQSYDFMTLFEDQGCEVQIGGSDQWGNIVQGVELIRKRLGKQAYALSFPLIVNPKTGKKFGKTETGAAIWLDSEKTHPFAFYNFFINTEDELAPLLLRYFSFKEVSEIENIIEKGKVEPEKRLVQKALALEMTELVHGREKAEQAQKVAQILYEKGEEKLTEADMEFVKNALPYVKKTDEQIADLVQLLFDLGLAPSKGEARRLVEQNGARLESISPRFSLLRKGKKEYGVVETP
ncbi:tyrosine--tRNA ligase [Candidatus Roizmanbacteria bacterium]|nr:tyrosine--tRNA ligase [Candidatus Roizmanbacteria bacterium]